MRTNPKIGKQLDALMMENLARFFMHLKIAVITGLYV